ncbi:DegT/DnrJ/EryC1/StrS family aminotransferase [Flavobacteriales bacterium]|nr:DegT/DnrJ/EryC1/StrS family aminotransferase [Flavobacteriales bacterium]
MINCLDLKGQHAQVKDEVFKAFEEVYAKTAFSGGPFVQKFEEDFSKFCAVDYSSGCNNGTNALHLSLMALNIEAGDEVILPANTFIATAWAVSYVGAIPVFVDCDPNTWEISPKDIEAKITKKTKLIIGVHLYGMPFDIDAVTEISKAHNILFIEDAAQAQGAYYKGKRVGGFGEMACFSFYPGKNLGACGEAGGITSNNKAYIDKIAMLRNHGCEERYYHDILGYNMRMGGLEGASLSIKLKYLDEWNGKRQDIASRYQSGIVNDKVKMQSVPSYVKSVYHIFVVTVEDKDAFVKHLKNNGVNPAFHYPVPCHLQKAYADLNYKSGDFPNSEYLASHCVSLPMYAELASGDVDEVIKVVNSY